VIAQPAIIGGLLMPVRDLNQLSPPNVSRLFKDAVLLTNGLSIEFNVSLLPRQNVPVGHLYLTFFRSVYGFDFCIGDTCQTCAQLHGCGL